MKLPGISKNVTQGESQLTWEGGRAGISKNVTNAGSQLTWEGGRAGISKNVTSAGSQLTWEGGQGRNKQKRYIRGVTTDLLDV